MESQEMIAARLDSREALLATVRELRGELERVVAAAGEGRLDTPGSSGDWTLKDEIAHLTGWRLLTAARLEAGLQGGEPVVPWPSGLNEEDNTDAINRWFYETNRDRSVDEVLRESAGTFDRVERAIAALPEDDLLRPGRFPWLGEWALGPGVVGGMYLHYHEDHEPAIRALLG